MNTLEAAGALARMQKLGDEEKLWVISNLVKNEDMSLMGIIYAETQRLETYRENARYDIGILARAGIDLAKKNIKNVAKIKDPSKRQLGAAQVKTLLSTRVYEGTEFEKEINSAIDYSEINPKWYKQCWQLRSIKGIDNISKEIRGEGHE